MPVLGALVARAGDDIQVSAKDSAALLDVRNVGWRIERFLEWLDEQGYEIVQPSEGSIAIVTDASQTILGRYLQQEWRVRLGEIAARFWSHVDCSGGPEACWLWKGKVQKGRKSPYGFFSPSRFIQVPAHRFAYELLVGPIPEGAQIDHVKARGCTSTLCVNPAHLEPVTPRENVRRSTSLVAANMAKTHCTHGHEFTPENTYSRPSKPTERSCRACRAASDQASKAARRGQPGNVSQAGQ